MQLLKITEVAERLGVHRITAYELLRIGALPTVRIGRAVRVSPDALQRFIDTGGTAVSPTLAQPRA